MSCNFLGSYETSSSVFITMLQKYYPSMHVSVSSPGSPPTQTCAKPRKNRIVVRALTLQREPVEHPLLPTYGPSERRAHPLEEIRAVRRTTA